MAKRMKIENVKNINLNAPSANTVKGAAKADTKRQSSISPNGRFDTFTMIGTGEKKNNTDSVKTLDAKTSELVRSLSALSAEEKVEFAYDSYLDMQKALLHMKDMVNAQVESFKDLKDKKVYYTDLLSSGCTIGEGGGKYKFSSYAEGDNINSKDVLNALNKVQKGLDSWCREVSDEEIAALPLPEHVTGYITYRNVYFRDEAMFKTGAVVFSGVTGISDSALEIESGELYFSKEGVNEENFLEKANSLLNSITERSKKLEDLWSEYSYNHRRLMDKLKERLESAERLEEKKGTSIAKMIAKYSEYLYKIDAKN